MQVQITKRADGAGVLRCVRSDGSITWQKQNRHGAFFALHDLTHYAVETTLGYTTGFFGLIAAGWEVEDTTGKGTRGPLPSESVVVEAVVGLFFTEAGSGSIWTATDFAAALATHLASARGAPANPASLRGLTDADLGAVRKRRSQLFQQWESTPTGQLLTLEF